jgi:beta-galactosidase GanA
MDVILGTPTASVPPWLYQLHPDVLSGNENGLYTLARAVAAAGKLAPLLAAPYGVEVTSREDASTTFYFLLNLTEDTKNSIALPHPMVDLIAEREGVTSVSLGPLEVGVLASSNRSSTHTQTEPSIAATRVTGDRGWTGEHSTSWRALPRSAS